MINIVLVEPEIPQNTGNIVRLCACVGAKLFLVGRLGFSMSSAHLKRCGLDYWDKVEIEKRIDIQELFDEFGVQNFYFLSTKAQKIYTDVKFKNGDFLVFGPESRGLDENLLKKYFSNTIKIPMKEGLRSLNLSNSVAVALYEGIRQIGEIN